MPLVILGFIQLDNQRKIQPNTMYLFKTLYTKCAMSFTPSHLGTKKEAKFLSKLNLLHCHIDLRFFHKFFADFLSLDFFLNLVKAVLAGNERK